MYESRDLYLFKNNGNLSEMGPNGSVWVHIKTGRSHMAQDHFKTPPDPKKVYKRSKMAQQIEEVRTCEARP